MADDGADYGVPQGDDNAPGIINPTCTEIRFLCRFAKTATIVNDSRGTHLSNDCMYAILRNKLPESIHLLRQGTPTKPGPDYRPSFTISINSLAGLNAGTE